MVGVGFSTSGPQREQNLLRNSKEKAVVGHLDRFVAEAEKGSLSLSQS